MLCFVIRNLDVMPSVAVACWIQMFFAWRIWTLGHNTFWKSVVVVILVVRLHYPWRSALRRQCPLGFICSRMCGYWYKRHIKHRTSDPFNVLLTRSLNHRSSGRVRQQSRGSTFCQCASVPRKSFHFFQSSTPFTLIRSLVLFERERVLRSLDSCQHALFCTFVVITIISTP